MDNSFFFLLCKDKKAVEWRRDSLSTNVADQMDIYIEKHKHKKQTLIHSSHHIQKLTPNG